MKIAVFTDSFFPGIGGTEFAVYNLCKELKKSGHEIIFFAPDYHREQKFEEFKVYRVKSVAVSKNDMAVLAKAEYRRVLKLAAAFAPDIIYFCTASGMARLAVKCGKKLNVPVVATIHTKFKDAFYDSTKSNFITNVMIKSLVKKLEKADKVTTVSYDMKRELYNYGFKGEVEVIRNGFPEITVAHSESEKNLLTGKPADFIFCGRLVKVKNVQFSLKALGILKREMNYTDFTFTLVGTGNYEKKLKKLVKKEGLESNVVFKGLVTDKDALNNYYRKADLLLFPSTFDNDSLVIAEAAKQRTPTLTFDDCGSCERLTNDKNGFTCERDERKFAEKIFKIINDPELYRNVIEKLDTIQGGNWTEIATRYEELFKSLIN